MFDRITQVLEQVERASIERDQNLANSINSVIQQQSLAGQLSSLQQQKEILAYVYEKAVAYTNLVIIGGYAGMFAIWQLMRTRFALSQELIVAALMTSSIILFVGFEVYKMISNAYFYRQLDRVISSQVPELERAHAWQIAWKNHGAKEAKVWIYFLVPTVITGFGAGFLLLWNFIAAI